MPIAERLESMTAQLGYPFVPVRIFLFFLDCLPLMLFFSFRRLTGMRPAERELFLTRLATSRWLIHQALFYGIKALVVAVFYSDPKAGEAIEYPGEASSQPSVVSRPSETISMPESRELKTDNS